jgi:hypothetical protein
MSKQFQGEF